MIKIPTTYSQYKMKKQKQRKTDKITPLFNNE